MDIIKDFISKPFNFQGVKGVGTISLNLMENQSVYAFIGENGIGKTKLLESLFATLFMSNEILNDSDYFWVKQENFPFNKISNNSNLSIQLHSQHGEFDNPFKILNHSIPIVYLSAQNRSMVRESNKQNSFKQLGNRHERLENYIADSMQAFKYDSAYLKNLNMNTDIEEWIIQRAQSSNRFQSDSDNREIEIITLLNLLNRLDERIDGEFLEISGNHRVFIKVMGNKTELSNLSSGFTSIFKILQAIVAGYSCYTNEKQITNVRGIVLIDEIESHLHNQWQVRIIPLLKQLFPNTLFFISTHSSLVVSQLKQGEVYTLKRNKKDGIVYSQLVNTPNQSSFIDLLKDVFDIDLNKTAIKQAEQDNQYQAKQSLLDLVNIELDNME